MKQKQPNKFELELEQYKVDLKTASQEDNKERIKELNRFIRNLEAIIKRLKK